MALKNGKKVLRTLADPIIEEFPLFILTLLIANLGAIRLLHGCIVAHYAIGAYEKIFQFLSAGTVVSYLFAAIAFYAKKGILRYCFMPSLLYSSLSTFFFFANLVQCSTLPTFSS